jgi:hypothetical protein
MTLAPPLGSGKHIASRLATPLRGRVGRRLSLAAASQRHDGNRVDLGRGSNDRSWGWQFRRVEIQDLHERTDLREEEMRKIEDAPSAGLLDPPCVMRRSSECRSNGCSSCRKRSDAIDDTLAHRPFYDVIVVGGERVP